MKKLLFIFTLSLCLFSCKKETTPTVSLKKVTIDGKTQGTTYHIAYLNRNEESYQREIEVLLKEVDHSLSLYDSTSIISRLNRNDSTVVLDSVFTYIFRSGQAFSTQTNGAFDMTVGTLVNIYGLYKNTPQETPAEVSEKMIDSIKPYIGYQKIKLVNNKIVKENKNIRLDANAITRGYTVDLICKLLEDNNVKNYFVQIGKEIRCKGVQGIHAPWKVAIEEPSEDSSRTDKKIREIVYLKNMAISTAGTYLNFYSLYGKKYNHIMEAQTWEPARHSLISATVLAPDCMTADALATSFIVMGSVKSIHYLQKVKGVEAYLIYRDQNGKLQSLCTRGFWKYLERNQPKRKLKPTKG
jgi:thiamine biosynthesis lipoprotein